MNTQQIKPIHSDELRNVKPVADIREPIPDYVIEVVNTLLRQEWDGDSAFIECDELVNKVGDLATKNGHLVPDVKWVFEGIVDVFGARGWDIEIMGSMIVFFPSDVNRG